MRRSLHYHLSEIIARIKGVQCYTVSGGFTLLVVVMNLVCIFLVTARIDTNNIERTFKLNTGG